MAQPPIPDNKSARQDAVRALALLDTPHEERFDRYTRFAQRLFDVPISFIGLIDSDRQWFKSSYGFEVQSVDRHMSFAAHTILANSPLVVEDTLTDSRFADGPMVKGAPNVRFYAGVPLTDGAGHMVGDEGLVQLFEDDEKFTVTQVAAETAVSP